MNAPTHIKNYYKAFGLDSSDVVLCEVCKSVANDFHHVEPRSSFGSTRKKEQDAVENIIALCRQCHDDAHGVNSRWYKDVHKRIISERSILT